GHLECAVAAVRPGACRAASSTGLFHLRRRTQAPLHHAVSAKMSTTLPRPPAFSEARNPRQKARAAGLHPDYWYAVEYDRAVKPGRVVEIQFWKTSIALYRRRDGELRALENRCAHRQLKLSSGGVDNCNLVCAYHGWAYDGDGRVVDIPHDLFGRSMPSFKVRAYPVKVRYGLIWIFPGDPANADQR